MSFAFNSSTAHAATVIFVLRLIGFSMNRMEALLKFRNACNLHWSHAMSRGHLLLARHTTCAPSLWPYDFMCPNEKVSS